MPTSRGIISFLTALAAVLTAGEVTQAQFHVTRHNGVTSNSISDGENLIATTGVVAGGLYTAANFQDDGGGNGNPNDFNSGNGNPDNLIPGNNLGVDENDWALFGHAVFTANTAGTYRFRSGVDDSARVILDGRNVVVQTGCCSNVDGANAVTLAAGSRHSLAWMVKEGAGGGNGEYSVSVNGGAFQLLSTGNAAFTIDQSYTGPRLYSRVPGLEAKIYSVPGMPNQNRDTNTFLAGNPTPASTLIVPSAATGALPSDTLVAAKGLLEVFALDDIDPSTPAIEIKFRLDTDDNGVLDIGGFRIFENDGGHGTGHFVSENQDLLSAGTGDNTGGVAMYTFASPGLYDIYSYVHNGGGGGSGTILSSIGTASNAGMAQIPDARLFVPEPSSFALASVGMLMLFSVFRKRRVA